MEEAAAAYRKALVVDPTWCPRSSTSPNIHYARDELIEAQALYERAIGLDPALFRGALQRREHQPRPRPLRRRVRLLSRRRRAQPGLCRRALLPGGHAREDREIRPRRSRTGRRTRTSPRTGSGWSWRRNSLNEAERGLVLSAPASPSGTCNPRVRAFSACAAACRTRTRAPRLRLEAFLPGKRQHIAVRAEFPVIRCRAPSARFELLDRGRDSSDLSAAAGVAPQRASPRRAGCRQRSRLTEFCIFHHPCNSSPNDRCSAWRARSSSGATSVSAVPVASARPVRPTRWT